MRLLHGTRSRIPQPWRTIVDWLATIALAVVFILVFEAEVAKPYRIPTSSMEPTLHCAKPISGCKARFSDRVVVNRLAYHFGNPKRGQIVVFEAPPAASRCGPRDGDSTFVKRLIGLPGEEVSERKGSIYNDVKRLDEPYVMPDLRDHATRSWPRIAASHYFFIGDNRADSCDSRTWGTVPQGDLIGPVIVTYWPPDRIGLH